MNWRCLKIMIALIPSHSICQMLQIFLEMNSKELRLSSKTRKKVVFLTSRPQENVKLRRLWSCNYGQKNVKKKVCCTCKVVDACSRCHHHHLWWSFLVTRTKHNTGNNSMNQSAGRRCQARENHLSGNCDWVWFCSDWLKKWREILEPIIKHDTEAFLR